MRSLPYTPMRKMSWMAPPQSIGSEAGSTKILSMAGLVAAPPLVRERQGTGSSGLHGGLRRCPHENTKGDFPNEKFERESEGTRGFLTPRPLSSMRAPGGVGRGWIPRGPRLSSVCGRLGDTNWRCRPVREEGSKEGGMMWVVVRRDLHPRRASRAPTWPPTLARLLPAAAQSLEALREQALQNSDLESVTVTI
jgi:hypothetical protein